VQQIVGSILYYTQAVDTTILMALSTIASKQTKATEKTLKKCTQLLDYLAANTKAKLHFYTSEIVLNIHSMLLICLKLKPEVVHADISVWGRFLKKRNQLK
jgi:hypothetical protein